MIFLINVINHLKIDNKETYLAFLDLKTRASTRQGLLFRKYKRKLTRSVNAENAVRQASRANASEGEEHNFFRIDNSNPNP